MNHYRTFLAAIAMGEYVAYSDCRLFSRYFASIGRSDLSRSYQEIASGERDHFNRIKKYVSFKHKAPQSLKELLRGSLLINEDCIFEKVCLVHLVFEPAAFAYCTALLREDIKSGPWRSLKKDLRVMIYDEVSHMKWGAAVLKDTSIWKNQDGSKVIPSLLKHIKAIKRVPFEIFGEQSELAAQISTSFEQNCARSIKASLGVAL